LEKIIIDSRTKYLDRRKENPSNWYTYTWRYLFALQKKNNKSRRCREHGLEPLAKIIMAQNNDDVDLIATKYLNNNVIRGIALQGTWYYCRMDKWKYLCS
jgi:hypothetical protein